MRAVVLESYGEPDVLTLRDVPDPEPGPEEVLVEVVATALNRADLLQRRGFYPGPPMDHEIPGMELSGRVVAVGARATLWQPGDEVMAIVGGGAYAERIAVHERQLMAVPTSVGRRRRRRHPRGLDHRLRRARRAGRAHVRAAPRSSTPAGRGSAPPPSRSPRRSGRG